MDIRQYRTAAEQFADIRTEADIEAAARHIAFAAGYSLFMLAYTNPVESEAVHAIFNYHDLRIDLPDSTVRDPVLHRIRTMPEPEPVIWDYQYYCDAGAADILDASGIFCGISCPIRPPGKRRMTLAIMRGAAFDASPVQLQVQADDLSSFTNMLAGVVVPHYDAVSQISRDLTAEELEALKRTFERYSPFEISRKFMRRYDMIGIHRILDSASAKLGFGSGSDNHLSAAIRAAVLGLVR
jgi:hypothetical protein